MEDRVKDPFDGWLDHGLKQLREEIAHKMTGHWRCSLVDVKGVEIAGPSIVLRRGDDGNMHASADVTFCDVSDGMQFDRVRLRHGEYIVDAPLKGEMLDMFDGGDIRLAWEDFPVILICE